MVDVGANANDERAAIVGIYTISFFPPAKNALAVVREDIVGRMPVSKVTSQG